MIGRDHFDDLAGGLAAVILDRHLGRDHRSDALVGREHAGLVVQDTDADFFLRLRAGHQQYGGGRNSDIFSREKTWPIRTSLRLQLQ